MAARTFGGEGRGEIVEGAVLRVGIERRVGSALVHTVGDAAWGSGAYRWAHNKGVELATRVAAEKAGAPGAGAGAAGPNGAGAGPRGGTTYAVPQK